MIHLFWSGRGFLVPAITFASCLAMELFVRAAHHDDKYYQTHCWPILTAFLISAFAIYIISRGLVARRELRDVATGELVVLQQEHRFLFIHVRYWPAILCVVGVVFFVLAERKGL